MSKEKSVVDEIHEMQKSKRKDAFQNSKFGKSLHDIVFFTKFIIHSAFASLVIACGAYAVYKGLHMDYNLARIGLVVAGVAAAIEGLTLLWNAVMKLRV
jgi:hypothetical protein